MESATHLRIGRGWQPGSRLGRVHSTHSYGIVFVLILATFLFAAAAPDAAWASSILLVLQAVTFAVALWTSGLVRADSRRSVGAVAISVCLGISYLFVEGE